MTIDEVGRERKRRELKTRYKDLDAGMRQIQADADHWNRLHPEEEPIEIDMDLLADVKTVMRCLDKITDLERKVESDND